METESFMTLPEPPKKIGKKGKLKDILGEPRFFTIEDEIRISCSNDPHKMVFLQKLRFEGSNKQVEYRLGYYVIGKKEGPTQGKWVWGQFATMMPQKDWILIIQLAKEKGWFSE